MKVILLAVAAFIVINIIMWTVIAISNKRVKRREAKVRQSTVTQTDALARTIELSVGAVTEEYERTVKKQEFKVIESIIMIHTDEVI